MIYLFYLRMLCQELYHLLRILHVSLQSQGKGLNALQQKERIEGRNGCTRIAKKNCTNKGYKCSRSNSIVKAYAVIAGVRCGNVRILTACLPVKLSGLNDDAAKSRSVTADELCRGVNDDVCAMLNGSEQIRGSKGIVNYQGKTMPVCDLCDGIHVGNVAVGIAKRL